MDKLQLFTVDWCILIFHYYRINCNSQKDWFFITLQFSKTNDSVAIIWFEKSYANKITDCPTLKAVFNCFNQFLYSYCYTFHLFKVLECYWIGPILFIELNVITVLLHPVFYHSIPGTTHIFLSFSLLPFSSVLRYEFIINIFYNWSWFGVKYLPKYWLKCWFSIRCEIMCRYALFVYVSHWILFSRQFNKKQLDYFGKHDINMMNPRLNILL